MRTHNNILASLFALIAIASLIGVFTGHPHSAFLFVLATVMTITLRADSKKSTL